MQISSNRPVMRSGASAVAYTNKPVQTPQPEQLSKNVTISNNLTQQTRNQLQAQLLHIGGNIDFTA